MSDTIVVEHRKVGTIEVPASKVFTFDELPGFKGAHRFIVMEHSQDSPFSWLICLDDRDLAVVIANPWDYFPDYDPPISQRDLEHLELKTREETEVVVIVAVEPDNVWFNLAAPLLINRTTMRGMQVIADDCRYTMREPMPKIEDLTPADQEAQLGDTVTK